MKRHAAGLKADWPAYLRTLRRREIAMIFARCPQDAFACGLELGAGDGFQSTLLAPYACRLIASDYRPIDHRPVIINAPEGGGPGTADGSTGWLERVSFMTCDAERVDAAFAPQTFDLVFSSNMLEHLPDPGRALAGIHTVMTDDGIAVHVVPSPFWKVAHLVGFYVNAVVGRIDRRLRRSALAAAGSDQYVDTPDQEWDNNPKVASGQRSYLARLLWPAAHGASGSNLRELTLFTRRYWRGQFEAAGFCVAAMHRGPVSSGYGFGLDRLRTALERLGFSSEIIYITVKAGSQADRLRYFDDAAPESSSISQ